MILSKPSFKTIARIGGSLKCEYCGELPSSLERSRAAHEVGSYWVHFYGCASNPHRRDPEWLFDSSQENWGPMWASNDGYGEGRKAKADTVPIVGGPRNGGFYPLVVHLLRKQTIVVSPEPALYGPVTKHNGVTYLGHAGVYQYVRADHLYRWINLAPRVSRRLQ